MQRCTRHENVIDRKGMAFLQVCLEMSRARP